MPKTSKIKRERSPEEVEAIKRYYRMTPLERLYTELIKKKDIRVKKIKKLAKETRELNKAIEQLKPIVQTVLKFNVKVVAKS